MRIKIIQFNPLEYPMKKKTIKKEEKEYCPECGLELFIVKANNEEPFWTNSLSSIYGINRAGRKYDMSTGKRLYREEWHCPRQMKTRGFFSKKTVSHYKRFKQGNLSL